MEIKELKLEDENYPKRLKEIKDSPKILYVVGDETILNNPMIAIVGSRKIDDYGINQTTRFANYLSQKNICIVSGLAKGVDGLAHGNSMKNKGKTVAVVASGFNYIYPTEHKKLFYEIIQNGGAIISEWEPDIGIDLHRFPRRNRIISGLSLATLVIEADYRSGSTITARYAIEQKRELFALPGNIDKTRSLGTNKLIQDKNAIPVTKPQEILDYLNYEELIEDSEKEIPPMPEEKYQKVYSQINNTPQTASEISRKIDESISKVNEALFMLELDEYIKSLPGGKYVLSEKFR